MDQKRGRPEKAFNYTYQEIARALGMRVSAVRKAVERGKFDPGSIRSILSYAAERARPKSKYRQ